MFDGTTLIVDVLTLGENSYALSLPAEDLWVAYEVVRRHVDANGVRHYSQMTEAKTTADGYSFKFDTGDTFTCASHLDKPTSSTLSDEQNGLPAVAAADKGKYLHTNESTGALEWAEGGSGGGVLVVTDTDGTLSKTWKEIYDAILAGGAVTSYNEYDCGRVDSTGYDDRLNEYKVWCTAFGAVTTYITNSASGYPQRT